jgi:hypothetical protein
MVDKIRAEFWGHQLEAMMGEIVREASICQVKLLDPGVVEAVLHDNPSVCGKENPAAFKKLRELLMLGFIVREKAFERVGAAEADAIQQAIREKLIAKYGPSLGDKFGGAGASS